MNVGVKSCQSGQITSQWTLLDLPERLVKETLSERRNPPDQRPMIFDIRNNQPTQPPTHSLIHPIMSCGWPLEIGQAMINSNWHPIPNNLSVSRSSLGFHQWAEENLGGGGAEEEGSVCGLINVSTRTSVMNSYRMTGCGCGRHGCRRIQHLPE